MTFSKKTYLASMLGCGLILLITLLSGCAPGESAKPITEGGYEEDHPDALPSKAKVVEDLGNGWIVFRLDDVLGTERHFLYKTEGDYSGDGQWSHAAITELVPR